MRTSTERQGTENNQSKLKKIITEMKNTVEGINSRLKNAKEQIRNLENRVMESTHAEQ